MPSQIVVEAARWINQVPWSHYLTLTTRNQTSPGRLQRVLEQEFIRRLEAEALSRVDYVGMIELGSGGDFPHIHALVHGTSALTCPGIKQRWRHGFASVALYDPSLGAAEYIWKEYERGESLPLLRDLRLRSGYPAQPMSEATQV